MNKRDAEFIDYINIQREEILKMFSVPVYYTYNTLALAKYIYGEITLEQYMRER